MSITEFNSLPEPKFANPAELEHLRFADDVARHKLDKRARREAERQLAAETAGTIEIPSPVRLDAFLDMPDEDPTYRVDALWPTGGKILLAAQKKAGKSTLTGNLIRALVDGDDFLDHFHVDPVERVVLIDDELDDRMLRRWLRDQGIINSHKVQLVPIRGKVSSFNILDDELRARWAANLTGADVVILDCLRPVLDALGLSEDKDAGRFLVHFDELMVTSGVTEWGLIHHMGHNGERSRGDSRIEDWPDAIWRLVLENKDDPASSRFFSAFGRDVEQSESALSYDKPTRHVSLGSGSRKDVAANGRAAEAVPYILAVLDECGELSGRQIEMKVKNHPGDEKPGQRAVRDGLKIAAEAGQVTVKPGPRNSQIYRSSVRYEPPNELENQALVGT